MANTSNAYELSLRQKEQQLQEAHTYCEELSSRLNDSHNRDLKLIKDSKDNETCELKAKIAQLQDNNVRQTSHILNYLDEIATLRITIEELVTSKNAVVNRFHTYLDLYSYTLSRITHSLAQ